MAPDPAIRLRLAGAADAEAIAGLHVASWRSAYRGSFSDAYLDGPIEAERRAFWGERFAHPPEGLVALVAADARGLVGFVCALIDRDVRWGTQIDNLHVAPGVKGGGLGRRLLQALGERLRAVPAPVYLFVLESNTAARGFYLRLGGVPVEFLTKTEPDGTALSVERIAWPTLAAFQEGCA